MVILEKVRGKGREIKSNIFLLYRGLGDPRMPFHVKILAFLIVAYIISPIDIIPDFIPILGLLDEVILVPIFLSYTVRLIPIEIRHEYEQQETGEIEDKQIEDKRLSRVGSVMIAIVWLVLIGLCLYYLPITESWIEFWQ
ncbi:MAG: DUF1232 domain-containing protein [Proteobacteria bacterium]|nr:DUF1232 domain-containing protein [Pseudomonadota bacterium]